MAISKKIALTDDELNEMMTSNWLVRIASTGQSGKINLTPMWFVWCSGKVYTFGRGQKIANIRHNPSCTILVDRNQKFPELQGAMFHGQATILEDAAVEDADPDLEQVRSMLSIKYNGGHGQPPEENPEPDGSTAIGKDARWIVFTPDNRVTWDNCKIPDIDAVVSLKRMMGRVAKK
jgi:hypothetical protein